MSPIGGDKPLFDLIAKGRRGDDAGLPGPSEPHGPGVAELESKTVTLPMVWIYAGVGLILLLLVAGYGIGFKLGTTSTRDAERQAAARDAERVFVDDPLRDDHSDESDPASGSGDSEPDRGHKDGSQNQTQRVGVSVYLASGRLGPDPRRDGVNYLELVTLPREKAIEAVRYLSVGGEEAIAVPASGLDPAGRGSNTSDSFRVIALGLAVPGDNYRSSADARRRFENRLGRLGKAWAAEGGASDFSDPLWRRFGG